MHRGHGLLSQGRRNGRQRTIRRGNGEWAREISLDLDMVSAICPNCRLLLVEASSNEGADLAAAEKRAAELGATEISNSFAQESPPETRQQAEAYDHPGTPTTASGGDHGYGVVWPAANPNVIAVGGTTLKPAGGRGGWTRNRLVEPGRETLRARGAAAAANRSPPGRRTSSARAGRRTMWPPSPTRTLRSRCTTATKPPRHTGCWSAAPASGRPSSPQRWRSPAPTRGPLTAPTASTSSTPTAPQASTTSSPEARPAAADYLCEATLGYDGPTGLGSLRGAPEVPAPTPATGSASSITQGTANLGRNRQPSRRAPVRMQVRIRPDDELRLVRAVFFARGCIDHPGGRYGVGRGAQPRERLPLPHCRRLHRRLSNR